MQHIDRHRAVPNLFSRLSRRDSLELAESATLIGSALGSVVAGLSGQVLFAATPLTLALWLNTLNRHRVGEQMRLEHQGAIADVQQAVASVKSMVETLPRQERIQQVEQSLLRLSQAIAELQQGQERASTQRQSLNPAQFEQEFAVLRRAIVRLRDATEANLNQVEQRLEGNLQFLRAELETPRAADAQVSQLSAELATLSLGFSHLQSQLKSLSDRPVADSTPTQEAIADLEQQVAKLQQQNREVVKPYLKHLTRAIQQLEGDRLE